MDELTIRQYTQSEFVHLVDLWHACFPSDTEAYAMRFMSHLPHNTVALVGEVKQQAVTMLLLLPAYAKFRKENYPVRYLYAGCTHPMARGRGYYRQLMVAAEQNVRILGETAIYLHPASDALVKTYQRLGYKQGIAGITEAKPLTGWMRCADIGQYTEARKAVIAKIAQQTVVWDIQSSVVDFFLQDAIVNGGQLCYDALSVAVRDNSRWFDVFSTHMKHTENAYCLWLPTDDSALSQRMFDYGGFTGMVGD